MKSKIIAFVLSMSAMICLFLSSVGAASAAETAKEESFQKALGVVKGALNKDDYPVITVVYPRYSYSATVPAPIRFKKAILGINVMRLILTKEGEPAVAEVYSDRNIDGTVDAVLLVGSEIKELHPTPEDQAEYERIIMLLGDFIKPE